MKILLKDPAKVDAVIDRITDKYAVSQNFIKYCIPSIREEIGEDNPIVLDIGFGYNPSLQMIEASLGYTPLADIPTDEEFLNDKE